MITLILGTGYMRVRKSPGGGQCSGRILLRSGPGQSSPKPARQYEDDTLEDMSTKTRREQRKQRADIPIETDWLWSCSPGTPLSQIAHILQFTHEPQNELDAQFWADERLFSHDLYQALFPHSLLKDSHAPLHWDAFDDHLREACRGGRLLVIRHLPAEISPAMEMLLDIIASRRGEHGFHHFESRPGARFAVLLDGWTEPTIRVRTHRGSKIYQVTPLGGLSDLPA